MAERPGVAAALATIAGAIAPLGEERVALRAALGRIAAADVRAAIDVPRFEASAMDGFAVRSADTLAASAEARVSLALMPPIPAGCWPAPLLPDHAAPIGTGAPIPPGADAVLVREAVTAADGCVTILRPIEAGRNVRHIGEDAATGDVVLAAGALIGPDAIGAFAGYGLAEVAVRRCPRLILFSTGSELAGDAAMPLGPAGIVDSNAPMIEAAAAALGLPLRFLGRASDRRGAIDLLLAAAADPAAGDILVSTGGVSAGDYDLVRAALEARGGRVLFHGIAMRPGKPLLFALLPDGRPFFGLPGNPVAALIGFRFFVLAAVRAMLGLAHEAGEAIDPAGRGREGTTLFLRGRRGRDAGGRAVVDTSLDQRSHILGSVLRADTWLRIDPDGTARAFPKEPPSLG